MEAIEAIGILKDKFIQLRDVKMKELIQKSFEEIDTFVEDANIIQLQEGIRADGVMLPDYSPVSVEVYGKPEGPIRLYDTGDFYKGITMKAGPDGIEISGNDEKTDMLMRDYGDEILGLTEENKDRIADEFLKVNLEENLKEYLL